MVTDEKIVCPNCGYTIEGAVGECCEREECEHGAGENDKVELR